MKPKENTIIQEGVEYSIQFRTDIVGFEEGVILKQIQQNEELPSQVFRLKNEWEHSKNLSIKGIRKALKLEQINGKTSLLLEYIDGKTIKETFKNRHFSIPEFLKIAIKISKALAELHAEKIIHKDINSKNILFSENKGEITIIDLGISTKLNLKSDYFIDPNKLEGSLAYISPEQTGRMNRVLDNRSDLYSLGVVFYEMLTSKLPFEASDSMEFIHCHIAKTPQFPAQLNPEIPLVLSDLVMKLLNKNAEDRYQSALGLKNDLEIILKELEKTGNAENITLAQHDFSGIFHINQKLYGRENELKSIMGSFEKVLAGESIVNLVSGFSGVGKSSLVHEIHKPITEKKGFFIEGKFDQFQRNIPYQGFIQAFKLFSKQLLTENETKLLEWKNNLKAALGENAGILTSFISDFELILGKHEKPILLNPIESQNRFNYTFLHFIKAIATEEHPLVIFLDDMQWTDLASLDLLKQILLDDSIHHIFLILSYRNNETPGDHPFMVMLSEIQSLKGNFDNIVLKGLSEKDISLLLSDTMKTKPEKVASLSSLIVRKTDGNPYYINEFLKSLNVNDYIKWNAKTNIWEWDEKQIKEVNITENVVHFLSRKLLSFSAGTHQILEYASCIGTKFNAHLLAEVLQQPLPFVNNILNNLMEEGYIIPLVQQSQSQLTGDCKFAHDRFQQAAYSLINEDEKPKIHYEIGKVLQKQILKENEQHEIFELTDHLNQGRVFLETHEEIEDLCQLNFKAGIQAQSSNAYEDALHYLKNAIELLSNDTWATNYDFTFKVFLAKAEAEYLNLHINEADNIIDDLLTKTRNDIEKATLLQRKLINYVTLGKHKEALDISRAAMSVLGISLPAGNAGKILAIIRELLLAKYLLRNKTSEQIINLPEISSEKEKLLTSIFSQSVTPAYFYDLLFYVLLIFKMVNYSLKNGNSKSSAHAYISYGVLNNAMFQNYKYALEMGNISLELNKKYHSPEIRGKLTANLIGGIYGWVLPLKTFFSEFYEGYKYSIEAGDFNYASMNVSTVTSLFIKSGRNLKSIYDEFIEYKSFIEKTKDNKVIWEHRLYNFTINELRGLISDEEIESFEKIFVELMNKTIFNLGYFYTLRTMNYYTKGEFDKALLMSNKASKLRLFFRASPLESYCVFYVSLALCANYNEKSFYQKYKIRKTLKGNIRQFEKWESNCPENFSAYTNILRGELSKLNQNPQETINAYKQAINDAHENKITHIEALANELLGKFCLKFGLVEASNNYIKNAIDLYERWGADLKVKLLFEEFPNLQVFQDEVKKSKILGFDSESSSFSSANLDLVTIMKASVALAGKVRFEDLLNTLMKILIENAGAQRGYFILEKEKDLISKKIVEFDNENVKLFIGMPKEKETLLPFSLIQYVYRTQEVVVVDDAINDIRFSNDNYITKSKPKSLLCIPIISKGVLTGMIYLENNLVEGAFTKNRIELLKLLSGQITVSIENSLLYENLEQKVDERTQQLTIEKKKSDDLLLNILPLEIAEELKQTGSSGARQYENVTVLFADFVNFTSISEQMSPTQLLEKLNENFTGFDTIIEKYGLEKIKTIGDAYLAVCGMPHETQNHAQQVIGAALELQEFMAQSKGKFQVRIGVNSGPVVAGIVGVKKFAYDVWGDTVNTASRMESSGEPGKVNISEATHNLVKDAFNCTYRGKIQAKNKGEIDMYFVENTK